MSYLQYPVFLILDYYHLGNQIFVVTLVFWMSRILNTQHTLSVDSLPHGTITRKRTKNKNRLELEIRSVNAVLGEKFDWLAVNMLEVGMVLCSDICQRHEQALQWVGCDVVKLGWFFNLTQPLHWCCVPFKSWTRVHEFTTGEKAFHWPRDLVNS